MLKRQLVLVGFGLRVRNEKQKLAQLGYLSWLSVGLMTEMHVQIPTEAVGEFSSPVPTFIWCCFNPCVIKVSCKRP